MDKSVTHFEVYPERDTGAERKPTGEYGWRFVAHNGAIIATGGESFTTREHGHRAIHGFLGLISNPAMASTVPHPPIWDVDAEGNEVR